jgi:hypothetical protein
LQAGLSLKQRARHLLPSSLLLHLLPLLRLFRNLLSSLQARRRLLHRLKLIKLEPRMFLHAEGHRQLIHDFKASAFHTLEFMASNLTAKAQKVVWEKFPDCRPSQVVAAISERCRQAVSNEETISRSQTVSHAASRGIKI